MTSGMNGQQLKEFYANAFESWKATQSDDDFRQIIHRGQLSRKNMAKAIGSQTSVFRQNPSIKESLYNLENDLRKRGILPPNKTIVDSTPSTLKEYRNKANNVVDAKQLSELETENIELRAKITELESKLQLFTELSETMSELGLLPR